MVFGLGGGCKMSFCWNCLAILEYILLEEKKICKRCNKEMKPPTSSEVTETTSQEQQKD
jgi:hypothetical protein